MVLTSRVMSWVGDHGQLRFFFSLSAGSGGVLFTLTARGLKTTVQRAPLLCVDRSIPLKKKKRTIFSLATYTPSSSSYHLSRKRVINKRNDQSFVATCEVLAMIPNNPPTTSERLLPESSRSI